MLRLLPFILCGVMACGCTPVVPVFIWRPNSAIGAQATQNTPSASTVKALRELVASEVSLQTGGKLASLPRTIQKGVNWKFWFWFSILGFAVLVFVGVIPVKFVLDKLKAGASYAEERWIQTMKAIEEYRKQNGELHPELERLLKEHQDKATKDAVKRVRETGVL